MECPIVEAFAAEDQEPVAPNPEPEPQDVDVREEEEEKEKKVTKPRRTKRDQMIKKEQCTVCLRDFNPAYMARHVCKPPAREPCKPPSEEEPAVKPEAQPPEPAPVSREVTAADVASYLRREKDSRRADKVARYSAAMFGP